MTSPRPDAAPEGGLRVARNRPGARAVLGAGVAFLLVVVGVLVAVLLRDRPVEATLPTDPGHARAAVDPFDRAGATLGAVAAWQRGLDSGRRDPWTTLAADAAARRTLVAQSANVDSLRVRDLSLRLIDTEGSDTSTTATGATWTADVEVTWAWAGVDALPATVEVPVGLVREGDRAVLASFGGPDRVRVPLWLTDRLFVVRAPRVLVASPDAARARSLASLARTAVRQVSDFLPAWRGGVVIEAPVTAASFAGVSGLGPEQSAGIAGVTASVDGAASRRSPVRVFVNPDVFDPLGPRGQQIVLTHETAHVAVGGAFTHMPLWLAEGFADYAALRRSAVPVDTLASQIEALVRHDGLPAALPGPTEFAGSNPDIGAWYEGAWLAVRRLALDAGERRLVRFYRAVDRGTSVDQAIVRYAGEDVATLVRQWREELADRVGCGARCGRP